ncbi:MAG: hypothetical protein RR778_15240 [Glutamicibacter sp.]|uniref:hypothetical protein n=1 Tax=Glutamicibacter sp. TaxID=1931995 RepID=UPI002FC8A7B2
MDELIPYMFYCMVVNVLSRTCAVVLAKRERDRTSGEEQLAALPVMPTRELLVMRGAFFACVAIIRQRRFGSPITIVSSIHLCSLAAFVMMLLAMGFVPLLQFFLDG